MTFGLANSQSVRHLVSMESISLTRNNPPKNLDFSQIMPIFAPMITKNLKTGNSLNDIKSLNLNELPPPIYKEIGI